MQVKLNTRKLYSATEQLRANISVRPSSMTLKLIFVYNLVPFENFSAVVVMASVLGRNWRTFPYRQGDAYCAVQQGCLASVLCFVSPTDNRLTPLYVSSVI